MKAIRVKSPVRIDFAGGWTDVPPYSDEKGGRVINASINKYVEGKFTVDARDRIFVRYKSNIPVSSGLGTSAAMNVVWLKMILSELPPEELAEKAFWLEKLLGIAGGRQDQYASAIGGINYMSFHLNQVRVHPMDLSPGFIRKLENSLVLCYTGRSRVSGNLATEVMKNYSRGHQKTLKGLEMIRNAVSDMRTSLQQEDLEGFARCMKQNWEGQKKLADSITNPEIENLFEIAFRHGAIAGKATGAGGGGSLLFFGDKKSLLKAMGSMCHVIPFKFDFKGIQIAKE